MTKKQDIVIIGGGIIGLATAFYMNRTQAYNVTLFDDAVGQATKATGGIVSPWLSRRRNQTWYQLVKTAAAFYPTFIEDIGLTVDDNPFYRRTGTLLFKKKDEHLEEMYDIAEKRREDAPEIGELHILNPEEIKELLPVYTGNTRALYASGGAKVDGNALVEYIWTQLDKLDVKVSNERVRAIEMNSDNTYTVNNQIFDKVVVTTGAWIPKLLEPLGYTVDNDTQKGQIADIIIEQSDTRDWPVIQPSGGFNVVPFDNGHVLIGATHEKDTGYTIDLIPELVQPYIDKAAQEISDSFSRPVSIDYRVGVRSYTSDQTPYFGKVPGAAGLYAASGMGATGLTSGPLVGKMLSQIILDEPTILDLEPYNIDNYIKKIPR